MIFLYMNIVKEDSNKEEIKMEPKCSFYNNKEDSKEKEGISEAKKRVEPLVPFRLPIDYLDEKVLHPLSDVVASDLELVSATASDPMYDILLKPKIKFR